MDATAYAGPVYSPSATKLWMQCPLKRHLSRLVKPTVSTNRDIAAVLGRAVAAGLAAFYTGHSDPAGAAGQVAGTELVTLPPPLPSLVGARENLPKRAHKLVSQYIDRAVLPTDWKVLHAEEPMGAERCIPDLVVQPPGLSKIVIDFKTTGKLTPYMRTNRFIDYRTSWQLYHYAWRVGTLSTMIVVIVETPFEVIPWVYTIARENLDRWFETAHAVWGEMREEELGLRPIRQAASHVDQYGPCEFYEDCFGG